MEAHGQTYVVVDDNNDIVDELQARGKPAIAGNALQPGLLERTNLPQARWLISAIPNSFESGNLIGDARSANPSLKIVGRAHSNEEVEYLRKCGADVVIIGEQEIAQRITEHLRGASAGDASDT
jgi:CPA2 family monovalent cation:H+ antiporter-2